MSAKTITIFSNKGGVGKTFVTVNLGCALALAGYKTLIIDFDFQATQDMARMLNVSPHGSIVDALAQIDKNDDPNVIREFSARHSCGVEFIPAVKSLKQIGHITPDTIKPFLRKAIESYDYILVDAGKTFSETLVTVLDHSNLILLVATPDILAVYQIKWCVEVLQSLQFPLKMVQLILNRSESRGSVAWQEVRSAIPCEIFSHVTSDGKAVGMALNRGIPCVIDSPRAKVSEAFLEMVRNLQKDIYVQVTDVEKSRSSDDIQKPSEFWEKYGISQQLDQNYSDLSVKEEDEVVTLKRRIHERLIERLSKDGIRMDTLSDSRNILRIKKTAEEVVGNLLLEESGGKISSHEERVRLARDIVNEAVGLGPLEDFLADGDISDIMVNNRDQIYVEKNGKIILTNKKFVSDEKMRAIIDRIIAPLGRRIDESNPMVDARLPDGSRINAIIPPLSLNGPMITIRKFGAERIVVGDLMTRFKSLNQPMADFLQACVVGRKNIIVSGGTGAGKTTLLNVLSEFIPDNERIITLEDAAELKLKKSHWARLESRPSNIEGKGAVTIRDLFINCLRMRPDRIVIGECRGGEVLDMLQAMNTGHDGSLTTLHANSTRDAITRLHSMMLLSGIELPVRAVNEMISSAIQIVVHISRFSDGTRKITGISETVGLSKDFHLQLSDIFVFKQKGLDTNGTILGDYQATGYIPMCYEEFATRGLPIDQTIFTK
jgi:pilus assembly protein CpaF